MKKKRQKNYLSIFLVMIAGALMLFFIHHQFVSLTEARQEAAALKEDLSQTNVQIHSLVKLQNQAIDLQEQIDKLAQVMPGEPLEDLLIRDLQTKASSHDLQLVQVSFDQYASQKDYVEMPFNMTLEGQYLDLIYFLKDLQRGPRAVQVRGINITKVDPDLPLIKIAISACTFYTNN